jgi:serine/threonine protein kinase/tetratricopeptide (TPR) repeat protein
MRERSSQAKAIFLEAIEEHTPEQWPAFVEQTAAGDAQLRAEVEKLLRTQAEMGSFHEAPRASLPETVSEWISERPGSSIGPYKLLEQIGEGGFGIVFLAEQQQPIRRQVALKVLKPGMDTSQVIARFESERQALALMSHPNIARVLDGAATVSDRPYFVMELVKGVPITEFCDQHRLGLEARLRLFLDVCHAIQHAHHKGVIHRDIKPANVLVTLHDGAPVVKVIDFGVAKATGPKLTARTLFTVSGQMIGTPAYMSPEQAQRSELDIDTRSDVYALGVLLYELLTGTTPLEDDRLRDADYAELQRLIREEEAPRPSTRLSSLGDSATLLADNRGLDVRRLTQLLADDLDWVVMKALEKDRNRRYDTPASFAEDVARYLRREAVLARPPSLAYKVKRFAQRNRAAVLTIAAITAALLAGASVATWEAVSATRAEAAARAAAAAERQAREDAEAREAQTRKVLNFMKFRVFAAARPEGQEGGLGHDVTLRKAVEAALPYVEKSFAREPLIEAQLRLTLGASFAYLGEHRTAAAQFQAARTLLAWHCGRDHPDTLRSANNLANCYYGLGRYTDALALFKETLALQKARLGPDHPDTLTSMTGLGNTYHALGRYEALALREQTLARLKERLGPDHPDTLLSMNNLANNYHALGRYDDALKLREQTLARCKARFGPHHPETLRSQGNLAGSYHALGRHAEALKMSEETLALRKAYLGPNHPETLMGMNNLAVDYHALGRHADALDLHKETLALRKARLGADHPDTLRSMSNLAHSYSALRRSADARALYEETLGWQKARLGRDHPDTLSTMTGLADCYSARGRHADALALYEETLAVRKGTLGPDHRDTLLSQWGVADRMVRLGRGAEAVPLIDECVRRARGKSVPPWLLPRLLELRLRHFQMQGDPAGCRQTAAMWESLQRTDKVSLYVAACLRAVTASVTRQADPSPEGGKQADAEADRAMTWLKQAIAAGYSNTAHLERSRDLGVLRQRADFTKLMAGIKARSPKN